MKKSLTEKDTILVDCDGVLNRFDVELIKELKPNWTDEERISKLRNLNNWDVFLLFKDEPDTMEELYKLLSNSEWWWNLKPVEQSQAAVEKFRSKDSEVICITSPWISRFPDSKHECKNWDHVRRDWLNKYYKFDKWSQVVITSRKELYFGHAFIDDKIETIKKWWNVWKNHFDMKDIVKNGPRAILFETNTNFKENWHPRMKIDEKNWKFIHKEEK